MKLDIGAWLVGTLLLVSVTACSSEPSTSGGATPGGGDAGTVADAAAQADGDAVSDAAASDDVVTVDASAADVSTAPACNPLKNTGCTDGQHCGYNEESKPECRPNGSHAIGEECGDGAGCIAGACVTDGSATSRCAPYCISDANCSGSTCNGIEGRKWKTCDVSKYESCDPVAQNCKNQKHSCYFDGGFVCLVTGSKSKLDPCTAPNDCSPGLVCWASLCRKLCKPPAGPPSCDDIETPCSKLASGYGYCDE